MLKSRPEGVPWICLKAGTGRSKNSEPVQNWTMMLKAKWNRDTSADETSLSSIKRNMHENDCEGEKVCSILQFLEIKLLKSLISAKVHYCKGAAIIFASGYVCYFLSSKTFLKTQLHIKSQVSSSHVDGSFSAGSLMMQRLEIHAICICYKIGVLWYVYCVLVW